MTFAAFGGAVVACTEVVSEPSTKHPAPEPPSLRFPPHAEPAPDPSMPQGLGVYVPLEDAHGTALQHFAEALRRTERGDHTTRIAVFGASHMANDHFVGFVRDRLQRRYGESGRGFVLAAWPSDLYHYWQWGAEVELGDGWERIRLGIHHGEPDHYGIGGLIFDSGGSAARARVRTASWGVGQRADSVEFWFHQQPDGGAATLVVDGEAHRIDTAADEPSPGFFRLEVEDGPHEIQLEVEEGSPVRVYGLVLERDYPGVVVDNLGLAGARARNHLKWLEPTHSIQLRRRAPDLVIFAYGGNEGNDDGQVTLAQYRENATGAIEKMREAAPEASCILMGPFDKPQQRGARWVHRERTTSIATIQREIAIEQNCAFFDTVTFMGGQLSMTRWVEEDLARGDHVHLGAQGYRRLGEVFLQGLCARLGGS